jgi:hypothetical protein
MAPAGLPILTVIVLSAAYRTWLTAIERMAKQFRLPDGSFCVAQSLGECMRTAPFRCLLLLVAWAAAAYSETITESGFLQPSLVTTSPQNLLLFIDSFDSSLGTLEAASIGFDIDATFQATILANVVEIDGSAVPQPVVYQANLFTNTVQVNGSTFAAFALVTPLEAGVFLPVPTLVSVMSQTEQISFGVLPTDLSVFVQPAGDIPLPLVQITTSGVYMILDGNASFLPGSIATLDATSVSVTYTYTPVIVGSGSATPAPETSTLCLLGSLGMIAAAWRKRATK